LILLIDAMAERYGVLPSKILTEADTFDLMIMDCALTYRHIKEKESRNEPIGEDFYNKQHIDKLKEEYYGNKD